MNTVTFGSTKDIVQLGIEVQKRLKNMHTHDIMEVAEPRKGLEHRRGPLQIPSRKEVKSDGEEEVQAGHPRH